MIDAVLGGGPFCEVGAPQVAAVSPDGALVAVGGAAPRAQWNGRDVGHRAAHAAGVYRTADLSRVALVRAGLPIRALAFHPVLPLVVVGTGGFDGGWAFEGELLLVHLGTGAVVSLLAGNRMVVAATWRDAETLDLILMVPTEEDQWRHGTSTLACSVRRADWDRATPRMLRGPLGETPAAPPPSPPVAATAVVEGLCRDRGRTWRPPGAVWALRALPDGGLLVPRADAVERWAPGGDEPRWRLPVDGVAHQLHLLPGGGAALVLTQTPRRYAMGRWTLDPSVLLEVRLDDGAVTATHRPGVAAVLVTRADGGWAVRDTDHTGGDGAVRLPDGAVAALGRYDLFNHHFDIRYAPDLLFLRGRADKPHLDKQVVAVDVPGGTVRHLFPLEWDAARGGHLFGGPGVHVDGTLVHAGSVHHGHGLLPGNAFLAARAYPAGAPRWVVTGDEVAAAVDAAGGRVYAAFASGALLVLDAAGGAVLARHGLRVEGEPVVPLSLSPLPGGRLAVGLLDGRVLIVRP